MAIVDSEFKCLNELDLQPRCGMKFESEHLAYKFYNMYGRRMRFSIRKDTFGKNKRTGEITLRIFVCSKEGSRPEDSERCIIVLLLGKNALTCYLLNGKYLFHKLLKLAEESGISLKSSYELLVQLDSEEQITNMFWADARMIIDYGQFGDVMSFDTTYKINKENRPLVVFVGLNHHRETVIFRGALMAVNDKRYKELEAEYDLLYRLVNVKINAKMLIQAREVYTKAIFLEFQQQFEQAVELDMNCVTKDGNVFYSVNMDYASKAPIQSHPIVNGIHYPPMDYNPYRASVSFN
ncbi:hypothetical protein Dsin_012161 [Dipteronia sinensis]|uniref:FAR1 domain-containing protein n=1 Tax=Dipteronia sinensis TaxID=43782 RepID=A0AAE0AHS8_9ROSI|nr:hypothetical protein Dsin_012161 [Dipteronia sinensis]